MNPISQLLGTPLVSLYGAIGNFTVAIILYLLIMRVIMVVVDYFTIKSTIHSRLSSPFSKKIKEKFIGKDGEKFTNASMELFKLTKTSYLGRIVPYIIYIPYIALIFNLINSPISLFFPQYSTYLPQMQEIALTVNSGYMQEFGIIRALRENPSAFTSLGVDIAPLQNFNTGIFGLDVIEPVKLNSLGVILPILIAAYYIYKIVKLLIPVVKKQVSLSKVGFSLGLNIFLGFSIAGTAFTMNAVYHLYFIIFFGLGLFVHWIINKMLTKIMKPWIIETNTKCQELLKKYGIEDSVSAVFIKEQEISEEEECKLNE